MNTTQMRNQLKQYIDQLSPESLEMVTDFVTNLVNQDNDDATEELLQIVGFQEAFEKGKQQIKEGKVKDWRTIRDDV
ncbi:hypothetical protein [Aphanothece sacrum]|uniref:Sulfite reductase n=1 Tax=Aphanothece sacrum FPU1 TaxID=1920663 RepID=A0A401IBS9_APHSA|nr:hypothetical protein [Aphanothece sacrum]GBF78674.1 sulfite reductase [Aphanothece sacrum FPU1]GBF84963.1 sulfite reductase [Aphanothece sacrum FPU3]